MRAGERAFVAFFVLAVAGALAADHFLPRSAETGARSSPVSTSAAAAYCPAPSSEEAKSFARTANTGSSPASLRRWALGGGKAAAPQGLALEPGAVTSVDLASFGMGEGAGVVESFLSPTTTDAVVLSRGGGAATAPCTGQPGIRWLFAAGSTLRGQDTFLLVVNPFQEDASVGVRLMTKDGSAALPRLRELTVRALTQTVIFLSDYHPEDESFGIDVTVSRGRLIVARYIRNAPRNGAKGISMALGSREPATRWQFAAGEVPGEGEELIALANPGDREALAQVLFQTEGEQVAPPELEEVPIPAGSQVTVKVSDRLPRGAKHGTTVISTNGAPIVAERQTTAGGGGLRGTESVPGVTATARRWLVPVGSPAGGTQQLAITNTGRADATVGITLLTPDGEVGPPDLQRVPVGAGRRASVDLSPFLGGKPGLAVLDSSAGGVTAEGRLFLGDPYFDFADAPARPAH